jgi:hypothetical protein
MGGDNAIRRLSISIQFDWLSMTPENPTVEMLVKVMGSELSMIGMGDVAAKDPCHPWIVL